MTILIIEREHNIAEQLKTYISAARNECSFLPHATTMQDSLPMLSASAPDVIFINIELSDPEAFSYLRKMRLMSAIVFTITNEAAIAKTIENNGFTYLLKPVQESMVKKVFQDIERNWNNDFLLPGLNFSRAEKSAQTTHYKSGFLVKQSQRLIPVKTTEINHFATEGSLVCLVTTDKRKFVIDETLNELEQLLDPAEFFRVNRKFILARGTIRSLDYYTKGQVMVKANLLESERIAVSRQQTPFLKNWLNQ
jgi:DNA-binding LytR/AlgR family response regulator